MSEPRWIWRCDRTIPSQAGAGCQVRQEVLDQLRQHHWGDRDIFGVQLALEEALVNAIKHGNRLDASKHVRVTCRMSDDRLEIEVADEGKGFDPARIRDPTDDRHCTYPNGRGVMLMRSYMDRVEYNKQGNSVVLEKKRTKTQ